ncbi:hypothetical protein G6035_14675 [Arthrobacter sp. SDTb3-6]|nr:hypothetical protein [Arthrobacter sp. SDTb3-6]
MLAPQRRYMDRLYTNLDLAGLTRRINEIQQQLIRMAAAKTYSHPPTQHDDLTSTLAEARGKHFASILT